jgi:ATP-dependent RNA helicase RhlE
VSSITFASLGLAEPLLRALDKERFVQPTPIQASAVPPLLAGRDLLGIAQTGTGKTAAFALPMLQHLAASPAQAHRYGTRALILAPTRELALQIESHLHRLGSEQKRRVVAILGGMSRFAQVQRMRPGVDIVVGTPGRICDLMATGELKLNEVRHFVLDEADRMLDLGFIRDIRRIVAALPENRQSALFSATMPPDVGKLAETQLRNPVRVEIARSTSGDLPIEQRVHYVDPAAKRALLGRLLTDPAMSRVIVFTRTKRSADRVAETLDMGGVQVSAIHGNKSQPARQKALEQFRSGRARVLVATDIAARGIDVTGISHVINFDLPQQPEDYVHRIGRTARAGASGVAISFCDAAEHSTLRAIERMTGVTIDVASGAPPIAQPNRAPKPALKNRPPHWREGARRRTGYRPAA